MVGLTSALNTTTNSIKVNSEAISINASNIANANNEKYIKKIVNYSSQAVNGIAVGVSIASVTNQINGSLKLLLDAQSSVKSEFEVVTEYLDRMNLMLGNPNKGGHLSATLNDFLKSFSNLISSPDSSTSKQNVINSAQTFTRKLQDISLGVQKLRYEVDHEIRKSAEEVNSLLLNIQSINGQMNNYDAGSLGYADAEQQILEKISELSKFLDVKYYKNSNDSYVISSGKGITLLDDNIRTLEYLPASSVQSIIAGEAFQPLKVSFAGGGNSGQNIDALISSGKSSEVTTTLENGQISGLQKLRDEVFTDFIERLDAMAENVIFKFNKHHNEGAGSLLKDEYLGQNTALKEELRSWSGKVRVGVVDTSGKPIDLSSENDPNFKLKALDIDLSNLRGKAGSAAGEDLSIEDIVSEINQYYMDIATQNRVKIGHQENYDKSAGIADIKLVSNQNSIVDGGNFTFDFELHNNDAKNFTMEILDLSVSGAGSVITMVSDSFDSLAGEKQRTNAFNTVSLSGSGSGVYDVTAKIKVINQDTGVVSVSNITYQVKTGQVDSFSKRISASSASGDGVAINNTFGAEIIAPKTTNTFLKAELVNKNGFPVASGEARFLSIKSVDGAKYRIVIDDNPTINGENLTPSSAMGVRNIDNTATHKGFSHYYGLNNLFIEKATSLGVAASIELNNQVVKNPALLSTAKLKTVSETKEYVVNVDKNASAGSIKLDSIPTGGTITVNGLTFDLTSTPSSSTDIDISSGTLPGIVSAIVTKLTSNTSVVKNAGIDLATYNIDPNDNTKIIINYNTSGLSGNDFALAVNLSGGGAASINDEVSAGNTSGTLTGGTDGRPSKVLKKQYSQSIIKGNNQVAQDMMFALKEKIDFKGESFDVNQTIIEFSNISIVSYIGNKTNQSKDDFKLADMQFSNLNKNFRDSVEVDIDEELSKMLLSNVIMQASSKMIATINKMFEYLINAV
jgi:flagellar hook-associated protein FlgK